jgi:cytochrome c oxidase assembly protein subunit 15
VLGGLRVVWLKDEIGIFHAALAQSFLVLVSVLALVTGGGWQRIGAQAAAFQVPTGLRRLVLATTLVIFAQLVLAATMRHQHAGLAIPDFPLAYGRVWPATGTEAIARYNQQRLEVAAANPITAFQVTLQMVHRLVALAILALVSISAWQAWRQLGARHPGTRLAILWSGLVCAQVGLGAWTIWSNKAADITTLHVVVGASSLVVGALLSLVACHGARQRNPEGVATAGRCKIGQALAGPSTLTACK